ncbi:MAG: hypothetical protein LBQ54_12630 [Planctomycetaceae bacterium]|nr:hypothetical protein [Planctomycetaceae bacterium]
MPFAAPPISSVWVEKGRDSIIIGTNPPARTSKFLLGCSGKMPPAGRDAAAGGLPPDTFGVVGFQ